MLLALELVAQRELHHARVGKQPTVVPERTGNIQFRRDGLRIKFCGVGHVKNFPSELHTMAFRPWHLPPFAESEIYSEEAISPDLVTGSSKRWKMPWSEGQSVQFRWEVFNVTNATKFDSQSIAPELDISGSFGNYGGLLTNPRVMQFALRYEF